MIGDLAVHWQLALFVFGAGVILVAGSRLAVLADRLADQTGLGEALVGAVVLGAATSLSGSITSVVTAWNGYPSLSFSNAVGGIAVQTLFLVAADAFYRRANLEHAAVSLANIMSGVILVVLLAIIMGATLGPDIAIWNIHPVSIIVPAGYLVGLRLVREAREAPMWSPYETDATHHDDEDEENTSHSLRSTLVVGLIVLTAVGAAGWLVAETGSALSQSLGMSETVVGGLFTSTVTSLPELVTTIAAVRHRALQLAVGGIIGGNAFDTLFTAAADVAYRDGSIYHAITRSDQMLVAVAIAVTGVLLLGLLRRQRSGLGGVGFEGWMIVLIYAAGVAAIVTANGGL